jgi:hypothetical protein
MMTDTCGRGLKMAIFPAYDPLYHEGLELVAIQAEYFVFKRCTTDNAD